MKVLGVIPARYASTRFPGKPLAEICGKPMIQHVYENSLKTKGLDELVVATDDQRIYNAVISFSGKVVLTSGEHPNGTSRCLEAVQILEKRESGTFDVIINIQGDEPFVKPQQIESVISLFQQKEVSIGTLAKRITDKKELFSPHVVKVVFDNDMKALFFSRQAIPFVRNYPEKDWLQKAVFYKHIGLYGYRKEVLKNITALPQGTLESAENLEQLRWLEHGVAICLGITEIESRGIDTPADLLKLTNNPC